MFAGLPVLLARAGTPFGSPNPPVWTFWGAAAIVGVAELPVEKTLVCTSLRGIAGVAAGRFGLLAAISTLGGCISSTSIFGLGAGNRKFSGMGVSRCATGSGVLNSRIGAGS